MYYISVADMKQRYYDSYACFLGWIRYYSNSTKVISEHWVSYRNKASMMWSFIRSSTNFIHVHSMFVGDILIK